MYSVLKYVINIVAIATEHYSDKGMNVRICITSSYVHIIIKINQIELMHEKLFD